MRQLRPDEKARLSSIEVLAISANKFTVQLLRNLLPEIGIGSVTASHDLADAAEHLERFRYGLVIADIGPASFDSLTNIELMRQADDKSQAETPVVVLTSNPSAEQIKRLRIANIRHAVAKPIKAGVLYEHVLGALHAGIEGMPHPDKTLHKATSLLCE